MHISNLYEYTLRDLLINVSTRIREGMAYLLSLMAEAPNASYGQLVDGGHRLKILCSSLSVPLCSLLKSQQAVLRRVPLLRYW